jgi:hypothetical protein
MTTAARAILFALASFVLTCAGTPELTPSVLIAAVLLAAVLVTRNAAVRLVAVRAPVVARPHATVPVLRQSVVAGPGRPQPRAPGARLRATT